MSSQIDLSNDDITFLLTVLHNATEPVTTQQLIDAIRNRSLTTIADSSSETEGNHPS